VRSKLICRAFVLLPYVSASACYSAVENDESGPAGVNLEAIVGGTPAATYPESAILNMRTATGQTYGCSATLIAPKVVLTAGHCVDGMVAWDVYVGTAYRPAASAETFDWAEKGATTVNPQHHDIGLVYLKEPIVLASYPTLNTAKQADGAKGVVVGRVLNGTATSSLYQTASSISEGTKIGYPYSYYSPAVIEHGDSGGAFFLAGTHTIAAVNSGAGSGTQVLARVDLLAAWAAQRIASHSGATSMPEAGRSGTMNAGAPAVAGGAAGKPGAGAAGAMAAKGGSGGAAGKSEAEHPMAGKGGVGGVTGAAGAMAAKGGSGGAAGKSDEHPLAGKGGVDGMAGAKASAGSGASAGSVTCGSELEPNNDLAHASPLNGATCGSLSTTADLDWFVLPVPTGSTTLTLTADKDASFSIGYVAGTTCALALTNARSIKVTANGANTKLCMAISSASHAVQSYKLTR